MARKVLAIIGTYRKGRVIDTAVSEVLRGAKDSGADTQTISLLDARIEFCTNCRTCTQDKDVGRRGKCVLLDDMAGILDAIDRADGLVLGAPTNFYNVNALARRFIERLLPYAYWPWNAKAGPKFRIAKPDKKAVIVTATACPTLLARVLVPAPPQGLGDGRPDGWGPGGQIPPLRWRGPDAGFDPRRKGLAQGLPRRRIPCFPYLTTRILPTP